MKKILLIEDNRDVRETTADILELADYEVVTAESGKEGVKLAQQHRPDIIICDIMMPGLDGYGVLHILSRKKETAGIPFIFLTAKSERTDIRKGMNLGADDYLTKPFEETELLDAVETRLRKSGLQQATPTQHLDELYYEAREHQGLADLSGQRKTKRFVRKSILFMEGDSGKVLYFIQKGKVKTYKTTQDGKQLVTGILEPGDFLGYMGFFSDADVYTESAAALEETVVSIIPKEDFFKLLYSNAEVSAKFIRLLSHNLAEKEKQLLEIAYHSVRQRVAGALLKLSQNAAAEAGRPLITIAHRDLAGMTGTVKETVTRTLADFKEEGLISINRMKITILDQERLKKAME
ncbi:MAG: response regulator [Cyclobacteriaceae bacterium]